MNEDAKLICSEPFFELKLNKKSYIQSALAFERLYPKP